MGPVAEPTLIGTRGCYHHAVTWSAHQYTQFEAERTRPVRDLLAGLPADACTATGLGRGPHMGPRMMLPPPLVRV